MAETRNIFEACAALFVCSTTRIIPDQIYKKTINEFSHASTDLEQRDADRKSFVKLQARGMLRRDAYCINVIVVRRAIIANQLDQRVAEKFRLRYQRYQGT